MTRTISAHFDGKYIVPDEPIDLPMDQVLTIRIESIQEPQPVFADLLEFGVDCADSPGDLAEQHDHYLYGHPKH